MQTGRRAQQFSAGSHSTDRGRGRGRGRGNPLQQGNPTTTNHGPSTRGSGRPFRGPRGAPRGTAHNGDPGWSYAKQKELATDGIVGPSPGPGPGRGRGHNSKRFNSPEPQLNTQPGRPALPVLPLNPPPDQIKPVDHAALEARRAKVSSCFSSLSADYTPYSCRSF